MSSSFAVSFICPDCGTIVRIEPVEQNTHLENVMQLNCMVCGRPNMIKSLSGNFSLFKNHILALRNEIKSTEEENEIMRARRACAYDCDTCGHSDKTSRGDNTIGYTCRHDNYPLNDTVPQECGCCWRWEYWEKVKAAHTEEE